MKITYRIYDSFNRRVLSNHRSIKAAVIAADKFLRAVKRANGSNSYIPTVIEYLTDDDSPEWVKVPLDEVHDAQHAAGI